MLCQKYPIIHWYSKKIFVGRKWLVKRRVGRYWEKIGRCSCQIGRVGGGEETLVIHGGGMLDVILNVFGCNMWIINISQFSYVTFYNCCLFQVRKNEKEADLRPVTPSKIPVGAFRVEEEKAINRALNGGPANGSMDSNRQSSERAVSPAPPSRIPKFSSKLGANYKRVQVSKHPLY